MKNFNFNETILYIDGTRNQDFEAARRWADEHETTFEEDMDKRDLPKRFFVIGGEPRVETPPEPTAEDLTKARIAELQNYLNATDWYAVRFAETGVAIPDAVKAERQAAREEISRLRSGGGDG